MKRLSILFLLYLVCSYACAQIQIGVVKTPTRRNVNGTWTKGQYISNATISILLKNNNAKQSFRSGNQGKFSFTVSSPFFVTSVVANKGTYTFLDADFSKKERRYSSNDIEILVDDPAVLAKVREEAIAYERSKIRKQIRAKEDEIEELKEANKLTLAEYNKLLGELNEYRKSSEAIVQQIAEIYATTDFDKLDEFNQKLLAFVEEGNFASADSLLKTQGSKEDLFAKIKSEEAAIKKTEEEVNRAKEYYNKEKEALAQRLYSEHLMFLQKPLMQDSALYCLKLRADLDTTNIRAMFDYANLAQEQRITADAIKYYNICLMQDKDIENKAVILQRMANTLSNVNADMSIDYALKSFVILDSLVKANQNVDSNKRRLCSVYNALANAYNRNNNTELAEKYYLLAIQTIKNIGFEDKETAVSLISNEYGLGLLYINAHKYSLAKQTLLESHDNYIHWFSDSKEESKLNIIINILIELGTSEGEAGNIEASINYFKEAEPYYYHLVENNPKAHRHTGSILYNNLGSAFLSVRRYVEAEDAFRKAWTIANESFTENPMLQNELFSIVTYGNLGLATSKLENKSIEGYRMITESIERMERYYTMNKDVFKPFYLCLIQQKAEALITCKNFKESMETLEFAMSIDENSANNWEIKGVILLENGDFNNAIDCWKKVLELDPEFNCNRSDLYLQLKAKGLIE